MDRAEAQGPATAPVDNLMRQVADLAADNVQLRQQCSALAEAVAALEARLALTVRTERLAVVDAGGAERAVIEARADGGIALALYGATDDAGHCSSSAVLSATGSESTRDEGEETALAMLTLIAGTAYRTVEVAQFDDDTPLYEDRSGQLPQYLDEL